MYKKFVVLAVLGIACIMAIHAAGRKDNVSREADNPAGFTDSIDINEKAPGKYNFYIESKDKAANSGISGPYNIYIDPVSDLPVTTIINPRNNMHVQGNLNIVGICVDDDAVGHVEFVIHRGAGDKGEELLRGRADGAEFWSYYLDTTNPDMWPDGIYTLTAWGVDINGLSGISDDFKPKQQKKHQVSWHLDRKKPDTAVSSHEVGALVAGRIRLQGTVYDGNGVNFLRYTLQEGGRYQNIPLKYDRRNNVYDWDITIDTRALEDGPQVVWFQARDGMGTQGVAAHLLFVNNTSPEVEIVYPDPDAVVNGVFSVSGYATHPVGLKSVSWKLGKDSGEFPIVIGNPWWVKEFDIRNEKTTSIDLEIRAEDLSGNATVIKRKLKVDQLAGLPKITLEEPTAGVILVGEDLNIRGVASDNDAVSSILYSLDSQAAVEIPCTGYFQFTIPGLSAGTHTLDIWAKDYTGIEGPKVPVRGIIVPGPAPIPQLVSVNTGSGKALVTQDFYSGIEIHSESGSTLELQVDSGIGLQSISYKIGSRDPVVISTRGSKGGSITQSIPIPADSDFGQVKLEIKAKDIYDRETVLEEYIYLTDLTTPRILDGHVSANKLSDGTLTLRGLAGEGSWPSQIMVVRGERRPIPISASIDPAIQVSRAVFNIAGRSPISATARNGEILANLPADLPADLNTVTLTVTRRTGETHEVTGEFWLLRPRSDNQRINTAQGFIWVRPDTSIGDGRFLLSTREPLAGIYNGRPLTSVKIDGEDADSYSVRLDEYGRVRLQALASGNHGPLTFILTDRDGREFTTPAYRFLVDNGNPELWITENPNGSWVQNQVQLTLQARDSNSVRTVDVSMDLGKSWRPLFNTNEMVELNGGMPFERTLNIAALDDGTLSFSIRAVSESGRTTARSFQIYKDTQAPQARQIVPVPAARVNGTIRLGLAIQEAGNLKRISYILSGSEEESEEEIIPSITKEIYGPGWDKEYPPRFLEVLLDQTSPLNAKMAFEFEDMSGNVSQLNYWSFIIDEVMDIPIAHIILPQDNEVITADFEVSGVMFDDDAIQQVYWFIDDGEENIQVAENGFAIPISLSSLTDNEHTITVIAEDIYGVKSAPVTRDFRVSLTEPMAGVLLPELETIVREVVEISGYAFDENGIEKIQISLDNGNTFNDAYITTGVMGENGLVIMDNEEGEETEETVRHNAAAWVYRYNSTIFQDGSNVVFVRAFDKYGISAIYSSLVNLDNTPPEVVLDSPHDGAITTGPIYITGRASDVNIDSITIELRSLDGKEIPEELKSKMVEPAPLLMEQLNLSELADGLYNIEIWSIDKAENITRVSRNVELARESRRNFVEVLYPLEGEHLQGTFNLYGNTGGIDTASTVTLQINGLNRVTADVSAAGYYRFSLDQELLEKGWNRLVVHSDFGGSETVLSPVRSLYYQPSGAWVTIDSLDMGDFAYERPWFTGRAGYVLNEDDESVLADKNAEREIRDNVRGKTLDYIDISFDNGNTFIETSKSRDKNIDWQYRLETGDMKEGIHYILVRANMKNGETAITRTLLQVDKTPPYIRLIAPQEGGRYNQELEYAAMAQDNVELSSTTYHLRKGDKAAYAVPGFLQGLYFDITIPPFIRQITHKAPAIFAGGVSYMDFGLGLSFFDDNVKLQFQYGFMTQDMYENLGGEGPLRYGGHIVGLKLLANLYTLPFGALIGPDWEWLYASFAIGANFSLFDVGQQGYTQSGNPTFMSALVAQIEFPKISIPKRRSLRTFSLFTEGQLWFVPTDVDAKAHGIKIMIPHIIVGLRMYVF
jgi:hypothetical protein